jgi:pimeloyl-ACP methyl ester carboxylesterase
LSLVTSERCTWRISKPICGSHAGRSQKSIKAFSGTDLHEDLKKVDVPTLVMHGENDQIVPIDISGKRSAKLIKGAKEMFYPDDMCSSLIPSPSPFH